MTITREELYRAVWNRPAVQLAREYGISDVALWKVCRRLNVPKPGKGYWAQKELGTDKPRPDLPPFDGWPAVEIRREITRIKWTPRGLGDGWLV